MRGSELLQRIGEGLRRFLRENRDFIESVAHIATAASVVFAVCFAYFQVSSARSAQDQMNDLQRELSASESYKMYLTTWLDHPELNCYKNDFDNNRKRSEYQAFVATMATAVEEIILAMPDDEEWRNTVKYELRRHLPFFDDEELSLDHYADDFDELVREIREETGDNWTHAMCI